MSSKMKLGYIQYIVECFEKVFPHSFLLFLIISEHKKFLLKDYYYYHSLRVKILPHFRKGSFGAILASRIVLIQAHGMILDPVKVMSSDALQSDWSADIKHAAPEHSFNNSFLNPSHVDLLKCVHRSLACCSLEL